MKPNSASGIAATRANSKEHHSYELRKIPKIE
jgi:hypothetical protein